MYFTVQDIQMRRQRLEVKWNQILAPDEAVIIHSGNAIQKPGGLDQTYPFLPHPAYFWLTGRRRETEVVLYNKNTGWIEFQKSIPAEEAIWEGDRTDLLVDQKGNEIKHLEAFISYQKFAHIYHLGQSNQVIEGKAFELRTALDSTRRQKDKSEVKLLKHLAAIAQSGYEKIEAVVRPGITEREIQVAYESEIYLKGAHTVPYDTIVGSGSNSAILHALPRHKFIQEDEFVLVDAGVDIYDYCVDITRMFPSSPHMSSQYKDLYQLVLKAHAGCIAMSEPGTMWHDVHLYAAKVITEGLHEMGILKGDINTLKEKQVVSMFFPHGIGHLVGLRVRDTGHEENLHPKAYAGARLRVDIKLEEHHFITVEPGCYFIPSLLHSADIRTKYKNDVDWNEVTKWEHVGGVRIEDNILITRDGNENITNNVTKTSAFQ